MKQYIIQNNNGHIIYCTCPTKLSEQAFLKMWPKHVLIGCIGEETFDYCEELIECC